MKKVLMVIGGIALSVVVIVAAVFIYTSITSDKLVCKSTEGNITIMFNDSGLTGYTARNISYDFENQKNYATKTGVNGYIEEFKVWFAENTDGSCEIKK